MADAAPPMPRWEPGRRGLGVCYYPEQWPESIWAEDARRMADAGIGLVRIGEFAWSRLEPEPGRPDFAWLDRAIDTLAAAGLGIVLGTPTATPPRWMLERHPDMLPLDTEGRRRGFGSRRHYCFSHAGYRDECQRIAGTLARRYGRHPALVAWQIDNEYGCHDTALSYSDAARAAFADWCAARYGTPARLNAAWGNVFWSMEVDRFARIGLPNLTVTEPNPAHALAFRRFSSDQVRAFNRAQIEAIRAHSDAPVSHNFMGFETGFDHFALGGDLDIATWDSYPLGFLSDRVRAGETHKRRYLRQGDPDVQAFHHDLYRGVGRGRWWVMEQQPGPVNWAPWNPAPLPGMVRLWGWEAFAHGAEAVCYFRWRQAPVAQEQMHAGLLRPDGAPAPGLDEARRLAAEIAEAPAAGTARADVALIVDYDSAFGCEVQPQGRDFDYLHLCLDAYRAARRAGLSLDIIPPAPAAVAGHGLVLAPGLMHLPEAMKAALAAHEGAVLIGPRAGARTAEMAIPVPLPPALPGLDARVARVETLPPGVEVALSGGGALIRWVEEVEGTAEAPLSRADGAPALLRAGTLHYLTGWPDAGGFDRIFALVADRAGLSLTPMPDGVRQRETGREHFLFNYGPEPAEMGGVTLPPAGVHRIPR